MQIDQYKQRLPILGDYQITVTLDHNPFGFEIEDLFQMATRINKKRGFLFVSKMLGKHLAVEPQMPLLVGTLLSMRYMDCIYGEKAILQEQVARAMNREVDLQETVQLVAKQPVQLPDETLFIGFAETATALGHAVFRYFDSNATYIHTTRESVNELQPIICFEEEHSHATSHRVYSTNAAVFEQAKRIVLVDDEMTTGNTVINIIETLKNRFPHIKHYTVMAILDWRSQEQQAIFARLEQEWGITIQFLSIVQGRFELHSVPLLDEQQLENPEYKKAEIQVVDVEIDAYHPYTSTDERNKVNEAYYLQGTGRFSLKAELHHDIDATLQQIAKKLGGLRTTGSALVVGTGEFMYMPMRIASFMGPNVYFQSSTRSPIYPSLEEGYTISQKWAFDCPENNGVVNFLYNLETYPYTELFLVLERIANKQALDEVIQQLEKLNIEHIYIVVMNKERNQND
ncbi:phosphoribosyltransferase family protein [Viridibacillus sp. YIM B01967]|uniref:Phosphoribosyltransferase family protein n=1 Tax=Viridibacillus soli TaxID=2798301 RepID=A0ABS1H1K8_9BACL|nr:phosphoribosyltransferase family protein [Viridibacillus soli]MBK3493288.1 phosphoribosyltransferase family protein [Viridibacillus soli]